MHLKARKVHTYRRKIDRQKRNCLIDRLEILKYVKINKTLRMK